MRYTTFPILQNQVAADIEFVAYETANSTSTSQTTNVPTGTLDGMVMLAVVAVNGAGATVNTPTGWVNEGVISSTTAVSATHVLFSRTANSEPSSYTWNGWTNNRCRATIMTYDNVDTTNPVDNYSAVSNLSSTVTALSVTVSNDNSIILFVGQMDASGSVSVSTPPSGMDARITSGTADTLFLYDEIVNSGATGTRSMTISASQGHGAYLISLNKS
jgi:hypothetical protein